MNHKISSLRSSNGKHACFNVDLSYERAKYYTNIYNKQVLFNDLENVSRLLVLHSYIYDSVYKPTIAISNF